MVCNQGREISLVSRSSGIHVNIEGSSVLPWFLMSAVYILKKGKQVWVSSVKTVCTSIMSGKETEFWRDHLCHDWWPKGKPESSMLKH